MEKQATRFLLALPLYLAVTACPPPQPEVSACSMNGKLAFDFSEANKNAPAEIRALYVERKAKQSDGGYQKIYSSAETSQSKPSSNSAITAKILVYEDIGANWPDSGPLPDLESGYDYSFGFAIEGFHADGVVMHNLSDNWPECSRS